jgi:chaperonin GroEL
MHRDIILDDAKLKMKNGIDQVANAVKVTMGVRGKSVLLDTNPYAKPTITNDGVTIARDLVLKDRLENAGAKQILEVAEKTNDNAGDGTTTSMILMQSIVAQGLRAIDSGADGIALREGIRKATKNIVGYLQTEKIDASDETTLADVATISCRDAEIGKLIAKIVQEAGKDGVITIEDRLEADTIYDKLEGLKLRGGYLHEMFVNQAERRQAVFSDVPVLVTDKAITTASEMGRIFEVVSNMGKKQAVVFASEISGDALATAAINWQKQAIFILPVRILAYGESGIGALKDVAAVTGSTYLDQYEKNVIDVTEADFGRADKTVTDKSETIIISNDSKLKKERIKQLQVALDDKATAEFEKESLRERIAKLNSGMFTIKVGGKTDSERNELKTRVDDAIKAARAAHESGVVAGGGTALFRAIQSQEKPDVTTDEGVGESVLYKACSAPLSQMAENSNYVLDRTDFEAILDKQKAIDFKTCRVVDAFEAGIVDPLKVVQECIENASSGAALFLTLEAAVVDIQPVEQEKV